MNCIGAQGEIRIYKVDRLPPEKWLQAFPRENGQLIIGHSETGHHHVLEVEPTQVKTWEARETPEGVKVRFALLEAPGQLRHLRDTDTHVTIMLDPGLYMFRTDREYDPYQELARTSMD